MARIRLKIAFFKDYDEFGTKEPVWQDVFSSVQAAMSHLGTPHVPVRSEISGLEVFADLPLEIFFQSS